ncbi:tail protein X, partial [Salmonella enterica]
VTTDGERWYNLAWRFYGLALDYERIIADYPHVDFIAFLPSGVWVF